MKNQTYSVIKKEILYAPEKKLEFCGEGEWVQEPDSIVIKYKEYEILIYRKFCREPFATGEVWFGGHLCGYVIIPAEHPLYRKNDIDIDCHGGITFNDFSDKHMIGFDCAHSGDYCPTIEFFKKKRKELGEPDPFPIPESFKKYSLFNPVYRDVEFCIQECMGIVDQLIEIANKKL